MNSTGGAGSAQQLALLAKKQLLKFLSRTIFSCCLLHKEWKQKGGHIKVADPEL
jgi:hypothetical protein